MKRQASNESYGGGLYDLEITDASTYRQVIQYYYHLHFNPAADLIFLVKQIAVYLKSIWSSVNPSL